MPDQPSRSAFARRRHARALAKQAQGPGLPDSSILNGPWYFGTFTAAETVDANLSKVAIGPSLYRYVPKLSSAGTPSAGQTVLVVKIGTQLVLLGAVVGDTSLAPKTNVAQ